MAVTKGKDVVSSRKRGLDSTGKSPVVASSSKAKRKKPLSTSKDGGPSTSKKRRSGVLKFVDDVALEGDDDSEFSFSYSEEDDDEDDDDDDFYNDLGVGCSTRSKGITNLKGNDARTSARMRNLPCFLKKEELSGDEHKEIIRTRYCHASGFVQEDCKPLDEGCHSMHPIQDPKIWRVKCMVGRERQIVFCFIQKFVDLSGMGTKLPVLSIFSVDNIKGYVFVEAQKESDILEACKGFCNLYTSRISQVAKNEIPRLFSAKTANTDLAKGTWVRVKSGNYKGDLAQVVACDNCSQRALVKLVPRINLQALAKKFGGGESLSQVAIPPRRLISPQELEKFRPHIQIKRNRLTGESFEILDGLMIKEGFLYKKVSMASLSCVAVQPSRSEIEQFESVKEYVDAESNWLSAMFNGKKKAGLDESDDVSDDAKANDYKPHDLILFGQKNFGVIIGTKCDTFQVLQGDTEAAQVVTVQRKDIKISCSDKMFAASDCNKNTITINDKVKVVDGPFKDKQGTVRHMYKGLLFIYDEKQTENCGFFGARAQVCENLKEMKGSQNENVLNRINHTNTRESNELNEDTGSRRFHRSDTDSRFLVGQNLRIRLGPLKGYLCRVVSVRRSNVTVKLDSLGKIITVNFDHLSEAGVKNLQNSSINDNGAPNIPSDSGRGQLSAKMPLDLDFTTNSCGLNTNTASILDQSHADNKSDKDGETADPWGSKLRSHGDLAGLSNERLGSWGKEPDSLKGDSSTWHSAVHVAPDNPGETSCWEKSSIFWNAGTCGSTKGSDVWEQAKSATEENAGTWGKETTKSDNGAAGDDQPNAWDMKEKAPMKNEAPVWGKTTSSNWGQKSSFPTEKADTCDFKREAVMSNEEDAWTKATSSQNKKDVDTTRNWCGQSKLSAGSGDGWANWNSGRNEMRNSSAFGSWNSEQQNSMYSTGNKGLDICSSKEIPTKRNEADGRGKQGSENMTDKGDSQKQNKGSGGSSWRNDAENESDALAKIWKENDDSGKWNNVSGSSSWSDDKSGSDAWVAKADNNSAIESEKWTKAASRNAKNGDHTENWSKSSGGSSWQNPNNGSVTSNTKAKSVDAIKADEWNTATLHREDAGGSGKTNDASLDWNVKSKALDSNDSDHWAKVASKEKKVWGESESGQGWGVSSWGNTTASTGKQLEEVWPQATNVNQTHSDRCDKQTNLGNGHPGNWLKANDESVLGPYNSCSGSSAGASDPWSQPASIHGSQKNSWEKTQETTRGVSDSNAGESAVETGGWKKPRDSLGGIDNWSIPQSSDTDWKKGAPTYDTNCGNWGSNSDNFDRRQDFGRGNGNRGGGNNWQGNLQNSCGNQGRDEDRSKDGWSQPGKFGDSGGRGRGQNWESGNSDGRGRENWESGHGGGRGQGRGHFQSSDWSRDEESRQDGWGQPGKFGNSGGRGRGGNWESGRGRGRGQYSDSRDEERHGGWCQSRKFGDSGGRGRGENWESGRGRGRGQGRGWFQSSDWSRNEEDGKEGWSQPGRFGDSGDGRGRGRNWESGGGKGRGQGRDRFQSSDWSNRQNSQSDWISSGNSDPGSGNKGKSFGEPENAGENNSRRDWNSAQADSSWNCATSSGGNLGGWTQGSTPSGGQAGDGWNSSKPGEKQSCLDTNDAPSGWSDRRVSVQDGKIAGDSWSRAKSSGRNEQAGLGPGAGNQSWNHNDRSSSPVTGYSGWELKSRNDGEKLQSSSWAVTDSSTGDVAQQKNGWDFWGSAADKQQVTGGTSCWEKGSKDGSGWGAP